MSWTIQDREALKRAIAMGAKTVAYGDRRQEYRSLDEMKEILAMMDDELDPKQRTNDGRRYASCSSGIRT